MVTWRDWEVVETRLAAADDQKGRAGAVPVGGRRDPLSGSGAATMKKPAEFPTILPAQVAA